MREKFPNVYPKSFIQNHLSKMTDEAEEIALTSGRSAGPQAVVTRSKSRYGALNTRLLICNRPKRTPPPPQSTSAAYGSLSFNRSADQRGHRPPPPSTPPTLLTHCRRPSIKGCISSLVRQQNVNQPLSHFTLLSERCRRVGDCGGGGGGGGVRRPPLQP